jgi:hypothetical protein
MYNTKTLTAIAAILIAATLVVGATFAATPAFAYQKKGSQENSKNGNTVTIQAAKQNARESGFENVQGQEASNLICTHPSASCTVENTGTSSDIIASPIRDLGVFPPNSHPYGLTYGQWSAQWWQRALSIPSSNSPLKDPTGANCDVNQQGHVWFLAGTTGNPIDEPVMRTCTIPVGKAILFPIINGECSTAEGNGDTEAELRACAKSQMDGVTFLQASIDGVPLNNLKMFRAASPLFQFTAVEDNPFGIPAGTTNSVADGFWVMLHPLRPGTHTISFGGSLVTPSNPPQAFSTSVEYKLTVVR